MKYALIGVIAFIIVVYAYTYIKHRKKRDSQTSAVKEFRKKYLKNNLQKKWTDFLPKRPHAKQKSSGGIYTVSVQIQQHHRLC